MREAETQACPELQGGSPTRFVDIMPAEFLGALWDLTALGLPRVLPLASCAALVRSFNFSESLICKLGIRTPHVLVPTFRFSAIYVECIRSCLRHARVSLSRFSEEGGFCVGRIKLKNFY